MNVAMYLRKSRADENNPHETLERHKEILLDFAKNNNLNVIDIFEEVISGDMLYNRTEILKLLDNIPLGLYDAVLCIDLDRLGRGSAADSERIFDVLKENNIKIVTLRKTYDLNNEFDEDYSEFEMFMARKELKFISRRMNRGRIKSINEGCFVSGAPFGYRNSIINGKHTLEIYEPEAQYVRLIFDLYTNQFQGITSISHTLERMGVKSKKGTPLNRSTVSRILKNHTYIGKIVWNKSKSVKGKNTQVKTDKSDWIFIDGLHEPIIDEELFYRTQRMIDERYRLPLNKGVLTNPLAGLVKCANCGKTMLVNPSSETIERYRLVCRTLSCNKASPLSVVEKNILQDITEELQQMELAVKNDNRRKESNDKMNYTELIDSINSELKKLHIQQNRLYDLLEQGIYTNEIFVERNKNINERINALNRALKETQNNLQTVDKSDILKKIPAFRKVLEEYDTLNAEQKNAVLKGIIQSVDYKREKNDSKGEIFLKVHYK